MGKSRNYVRKKRKFSGNRFSKIDQGRNDDDMEVAENVPTASSLKLDQNEVIPENSECISEEKLYGNRIFDLEILISIFTLLCCPKCLKNSLELTEDSTFGLCSNYLLKCKGCDFMKGFSSTKKVEQLNIINTLMVYGLHLIGKGYSSGKKLCSILNLPYFSKQTFRRLEEKLLNVVSKIANDNMTEAAEEIRKGSDVPVKCGVSVDGTWQRRGFSSLNGCVSAVSIDTGKILDLEVMSQHCRICQNSNGKKPKQPHTCRNHKGSAGSMESVGAYRIFERSETLRKLHYTKYYGDGDSKGYTSVKDIYGKDSVSKLECIGHVQKRVGSRLRKLKKTQKGLGGKGKLTDAFIDKLQNYYGIAIRSHKSGDVKELQSAVIAAFFHTCSSKKQPMHGQCPSGADSWCKYKKNQALKKNYNEKSPGLPKPIMDIVKPVYMELCDQNLLKKCLHGMTQNNNESFNGVLWQMVPKSTFVELKTLQLGAYLAVLQFNKGMSSVITVLESMGITTGQYMLKGLCQIDKERIHDSRRHSLPESKVVRKKLSAKRKKKYVKNEEKEGICYDAGGF